MMCAMGQSHKARRQLAIRDDRWFLKQNLHSSLEFF